jgi:hypothetical protein
MSDPRFEDRDNLARPDLERERFARSAPADSGAWIAAGVVALLLAGGIAYFAMSDRSQTAGTAPDATTGQSTRPAPAPAPSTAPGQR